MIIWALFIEFGEKVDPSWLILVLKVRKLGTWRHQPETLSFLLSHATCDGSDMGNNCDLGSPSRSLWLIHEQPDVRPHQKLCVLLTFWRWWSWTYPTRATRILHGVCIQRYREATHGVIQLSVHDSFRFRPDKILENGGNTVGIISAQWYLPLDQMTSFRTWQWSRKSRGSYSHQSTTPRDKSIGFLLFWCQSWKNSADVGGVFFLHEVAQPEMLQMYVCICLMSVWVVLSKNHLPKLYISAAGLIS